MEQLQKKRTQIQLTTWLAKPGALSLSQHRAGRQAPPIPASGPMKEPPAKSSMGTLSLSFSSLPSPAPAFPLLTGWPGLSYLLYPRPDSFRTSQALRALANRILRIH